MHSYFIQRIISCYYQSFWCSDCHRFSWRCSFKLAPLSFWPILSFFEHFSVCSSTTKYYRFILYVPWNWPFLQGTLVPFCGERYLETKIWAVEVLTASRPFWAKKFLFSLPPSLLLLLSLSLPLSLHLSIYVKNHEFILNSFASFGIEIKHKYYEFLEIVGRSFLPLLENVLCGLISLLSCY